MSLLIINTMSEDDASAQNCIQQLIKDKQDYKVIHTENMKISPCIGCNVCWLKTPGICAIKDDYEEILKAYLQYDTVLLSLHWHGESVISSQKISWREFYVWFPVLHSEVFICWLIVTFERHFRLCWWCLCYKWMNIFLTNK